MSRTLAHVQRCAACRKGVACADGVSIARGEFGDLGWYALEQARKGVDVGEPEASRCGARPELSEGTRCDSARCWCSWPPLRVIPSTGQSYTVEALPHLGEPWLFRYAYGGAA